MLTPCEPDRSATELNVNRMQRSRVEEGQQEAIEELDLSPISIIRQNSRMNPHQRIEIDSQQHNLSSDVRNEVSFAQNTNEENNMRSTRDLTL